MDLAEVGLRVDGNGAIRTLERFDRAADRATRSGNATEKMAGRLQGALAALGAAFGVREVVGYADSWALVEARIGLVTNSTAQLAAVQHELFEVAQSTRNSFESTAALYQRIAIVAGEYAITQREIISVVESANNALLTSGATAVEAAQSVRQLAQALGKGKLDGDEFRTMMEAMPAVAQAVAKGMGVATGQLQELSQQGKITSRVVIDALLATQEAHAQAAEKIPVTIGQAWTQLQNNLTKFVGTASQASGVGHDLASMIQAVGNNLPTVIAAIGAATTALVAYYTAMGIAAATQKMLTAAQTIQAFIQLAVQVRRLADVTALLGMVSKGVVGLVVAVGAATVGFFAYKKMLEDITKQSDEWIAGMSTLDVVLGKDLERTEKLTAEQKRALKLRRDTLHAIEDMIRVAGQELNMAGMSSEAAARQAIEYDAVNKAIEARRDLTGDLLTKMLAAIEAEKHLLLQALRVREAMEEANKALEEQARILKEFKENVQESFGDLFYDIMNNGIRRFSDLFDSVKKMFLRLVAEMASAQLMSRFGGNIATAMAAVFGGVTAAGASTVGTSVPTTEVADAAAATAEFKTELEGLTVVAAKHKDVLQKAIGAIAVAMAAFGTGQMVGSLTRNRGVGAFGGAVAGAGVGAALGSVIPVVGTAVGAAVGAFMGLIGGIKGATAAAKKHREEMEKIAEYRRKFEQSIKLRELEVAGLDEAAEVMALRFKHENELAQARKDDILTTAELARMERLHRMELEALYEAQEKARKEAHAQREAEKKKREEERYAEEHSVHMRVLRIAGLNAEADEMSFLLRQQKELQDAIEKWGATNPELVIQINELLEMEREYRAEQKRLADEAMSRELDIRRLSLLGLDEQSEALALAVKQEQELAAARGAGRSQGTIEQMVIVHALERTALALKFEQERAVEAIENQTKAVVEALTEQIAVAKESLRTSQEDARNLERNIRVIEKVVDSLFEFADSLKLNTQLTTLSPEAQMAEASRQFQNLLLRARGGDVEAAGELKGAASNYLGTARTMFASGEQYTGVFNTVRGAVEEIAGQFAGQLSIEEQMLAALRDQILLLEAQITDMEKARQEAKENAAKQIEAVKSTGGAGNALMERIIKSVNDQAAATIAAADPVIAKLAELKETTSGWSRQIFTELHDSMTENRQAVLDSAAEYTKAIREGANWATVNALKTIHELQLARLESGTKLSNLVVKLHENGLLEQAGVREMVEGLMANKRAVDQATADYIAAYRAGASEQVLAILKSVAELQLTRLNANTNAVAFITELIANGQINKQINRTMVESIQANQRDLNQATDAYVAAVRAGASEQVRTMLLMVAEVQAQKLNDNVHTARIIARLVEQNNLTEREIAVLWENRHAVLSSRDEQIKAIQEGKTQAHIDMLGQIAEIQMLRFDYNAKALENIGLLREDKTLNLAALGELRKLGIVDEDTYNEIVKTGRVTDAQLAKMEQTRQERNQQYLDEIAKLREQIQKQEKIKEALDANATLIAALLNLTNTLKDLLDAIQKNTHNTASVLMGGGLAPVDIKPWVIPLPPLLEGILKAQNNSSTTLYNSYMELYGFKSYYRDHGERLRDLIYRGEQVRDNTRDAAYRLDSLITEQRTANHRLGEHTDKLNHIANIQVDQAHGIFQRLDSANIRLDDVKKEVTRSYTAV